MPGTCDCELFEGGSRPGPRATWGRRGGRRRDVVHDEHIEGQDAGMGSWRQRQSIFVVRAGRKTVVLCSVKVRAPTALGQCGVSQRLLEDVEDGKKLQPIDVVGAAEEIGARLSCGSCWLVRACPAC